MCMCEYSWQMLHVSGIQLSDPTSLNRTLCSPQHTCHLSHDIANSIIRFPAFCSLFLCYSFPKWGPVSPSPPSPILPNFPFPSSPATSLFSVFIVLILLFVGFCFCFFLVFLFVLDSIYEWNPIVFVFLSLTYLTQYNTL